MIKGKIHIGFFNEKKSDETVRVVNYLNSEIQIYDSLVGFFAVEKFMSGICQTRLNDSYH